MQTVLGKLLTYSYQLLFYSLFTMKITVFVVLSCLCICYVHAVSITNWGNVHGRSAGTEKVFVKSSSKRIKTHTFTYPRVNGMTVFQPSNQMPFFSLNSLKLTIIFHWPQNNSSAPIVGIKHLDNKSHPANVAFVKGFIGSRNVTIRIDSQLGHGIDSTFVFYTQRKSMDKVQTY